MTNCIAEQVKKLADDYAISTLCSDGRISKFRKELHDAIDALLRERESAKPVAGCINADGKLCDPFMAADVIDEAIWSEPDVVPLYTHPQRKSAPVVTLSRADVGAWNLPESWTDKRVQLVEAKP